MKAPAQVLLLFTTHCFCTHANKSVKILAMAAVIVFVLGIGLLVDPDIANAFDPPVDQQGPLTVRIDGPTKKN